MSEVKMRPLWSKEECWLCGMSGYATRTEAKPADVPYYCEGCEVYETAHKEGEDGVKHQILKAYLAAVAYRSGQWTPEARAYFGAQVDGLAALMRVVGLEKEII